MLRYKCKEMYLYTTEKRDINQVSDPIFTLKTHFEKCLFVNFGLSF